MNTTQTGALALLVAIGVASPASAAAPAATPPPAAAAAATPRDPSGADPAVTECDRLASYPDDPFRVAPGVSREAMDLARAAAACAADAKRQPQNMRVRYQYARTLFYEGRSDDAVREMRTAADGGYPQAQFVYGTFVTRHREGAPQDVCLAEKYWLQAANGGRQAARVQYVRFALKQRFRGCPHLATKDEMKALLAEAGEQSHDFYERLMIEDLSDNLAAADWASLR